MDPIRLDDAEHLARAASQGWAILTYNYRHFLRIGTEWFQAGRSHAGIVISYRQYSRDELGALRQVVVSMMEALSAEALEDTIATLDQFRSGET